MRKVENKKSEAPEMEIKIIPLLKELLKKIWVIALVGLIVGAAVFVGAKVFIKPTYRSGFTAYVNNKQGNQKDKDSLTSSDVTASKQLVLTYQKILTSNTILTAAAESMDVDMPYSSLSKMVTTEVKDDTEIISVFVENIDPQFAYDYAQAISKTAPPYMAQIVEGSSMKIIDYPEYSDTRYKPNYFRFAIFGFLGGAFIVMIWIIIRYFMDDTIKSESEIETRFSIPILGVIPDITKASSDSSDYYYYAHNTQETRPESEHRHEEKK